MPDTNLPSQSIWRMPTFRVMALSFGVGALLMGIKFAAYLLTGSAGILSDALESIINVAASGFALYSVYVSTKPPDQDHPYGHGKIEYFSAGFEGALIMLAAIAILVQAVPRFFDPRPLAELGKGLGLVAVATGLNMAMSLVLVRVGRRHNSLALVADGKHLLTDVWTSLGVIAGLALVEWTGYLWLDPLIACLVAGNILCTGSSLLRESMGRLMDEAEPELLDTIVSELNAHRRPEWIHLHRLRARRYGQIVHVDLHMILPRFYPLIQSHQAVKEIESVLRSALGEEAEIIVHADPCTDPWCPICVLTSCSDRAAPGEYPEPVPFSVQGARQNRHEPVLNVEGG